MRVGVASGARSHGLEGWLGASVPYGGCRVTVWFYTEHSRYGLRSGGKVGYGIGRVWGRSVIDNLHRKR